MQGGKRALWAKNGILGKNDGLGRMRGRTGRFQRLSAITPVKLLNTGQSVCAAAFSVSDLESNRLAGI